MWNRWTTAARWQNRYGDDSGCLLCNEQGAKDAIEHYSYCKTVQERARVHLRLDPATFVNIRSFTGTNPRVTTTQELQRVALLVYATYRVAHSKGTRYACFPP